MNTTTNGQAYRWRTLLVAASVTLVIVAAVFGAGAFLREARVEAGFWWLGALLLAVATLFELRVGEVPDRDAQPSPVAAEVEYFCIGCGATMALRTFVDNDGWCDPTSCPGLAQRPSVSADLSPEMSRRQAHGHGGPLAARVVDSPVGAQRLGEGR